MFIQSRGETGLETLIDSGQLPETPHFPVCETWEELTGCIETLRSDDHDFRTVVIDTVNGGERLCHEHVCRRDFEGDWGDKGFASYGKGPDVALADWRTLLSGLDALRAERKMTVVLLCHTRITKFQNPEGADYDRYQADMDRRTWSLTSKWADAVLFGNFSTSVSGVKENKRTGERRGKGEGGQQRVMFCERHAAYDAKNRMGLPTEIDMGSSPAEGWANFIAAIKSARKEQQ